MKRRFMWPLTIGFIGLAMLVPVAESAPKPAAGFTDLASLRREFARPPDSARPHAMWFWIEGQISKEGIDADLEAMKRAGIGGVELYPSIGNHGIVGKVATLSPEWWALVKHAIKRAGELGLEVDLNNSPRGWSSSNGPWVTPELAMQVLTWSETRVRAGQPFKGALAQPKTVQGYYRDIAVLAYPTPEADRVELPKPEVVASAKACKGEWLVDRSPATGFQFPETKGGKPSLHVAYPQPVKACSLNIVPLRGKVVRGGMLLVSDDNAVWRELVPFPGGNGGADVTVVFPPTTARYWRIEFSSASKLALSEVEFMAGYRIPDWSGKAKHNLVGLDKPKFTPAELEAASDCLVRKDSILNLTSRMDASGRLDWTPPPGDWTILRFGHTCNGMVKVAWLECDKFDKDALDVHWSNFARQLFDDREINPHVQYVHIDSYEAGAQNWSRAFPKEFSKQCGYDLIPYLPVLVGRVVDGTRVSERVLWDFRQVCDRLIQDNYFGHFGELCQRAGKRFTLEGYNLNQYHCAAVAAKADVPMTEFWSGPKPGPGVHLFFKNGSSPGHLNGRPVIGAEAFTAKGEWGGNYSTDPWYLKLLGDSAFCSGINHFTYTISVHQPWPDQAPGVTCDLYGSHFERSNTWFSRMTGFNRYVTRCQYALQQGQYVADLLYFYGENTPNDLSQHKLASSSSPVRPPRGYEYDLCTPEDILERCSVKGGKLVMAGGMEYRLLIMTDEQDVTPAMVRRIGELVKEGATVLSPKPQRSPSLVNQPAADAEVARLAEEIWGGGQPTDNGQRITDRRVGKGRIVWGKSVKEVLASLNWVEDFDCGELKQPINFAHRKLEDGELYFVANTASEEQATTCKFRVSGMRPELWDPVTGKIRALPEFREEGGATVVPLKFEPRQSYFVMFRNLECGGLTPLSVARLDAPQPANGRVKPLVVNPRDEPRPDKAVSSDRTPNVNFPQCRAIQEIKGIWTVQFDPKWGGPASSVVFKQLDDWTKRPESGIRYYSGTATYRKVFDLPTEFRIQNSESRMAGTNNQSRLYLDLGELKNLAEVRLNGRDLGIVWCAPWRVEVTGLLREKGNELEIDVVNLWVNRMIGDEQQPDDCEWGGPSGLGPGFPLKKLPVWLVENKPRTSGRYTFCFWKHWTKDDPLLPSGLLGPVRLLGIQ